MFDLILEHYEAMLYFIANITVRTLEFIGISTVIFGAGRVLFRYAKRIKNKDADPPNAVIELGRSLVGQCGSLISRVTYIKKGTCKQFAIIDAGMNDLVRPALYQAYHEIENLTYEGSEQDVYDIVGPICESSDVFAKERTLPQTKRGDILAIHSAGAYGEAMAFGYNCRELPKAYFSTEL